MLRHIGNKAGKMDCHLTIRVDPTQLFLPVTYNYTAHPQSAKEAKITMMLYINCGIFRLNIKNLRGQHCNTSLITTCTASMSYGHWLESLLLQSHMLLGKQHESKCLGPCTYARQQEETSDPLIWLGSIKAIATTGSKPADRRSLSFYLPSH